MSAARPPFLLRLTVVVGAVSLLLGGIAAVSLFVRPDDPPPVAGPGMWTRVRIQGAPIGAELRVDVTWREGDARILQGAKRAGHGSDIWILPPCPDGEAVTLLVRDASTTPPGLLGTRNLVVQPGEETVVDLAQPENG